MRYSKGFQSKRLDEILKDVDKETARTILSEVLVHNEEDKILSSRVWDNYFKGGISRKPKKNTFNIPDTTEFDKIARSSLDRHGRVIKFNEFRNNKSDYGWYMIFQKPEKNKHKDTYNMEPVSKETLYEVIEERKRIYQNKND